MIKRATWAVAALLTFSHADQVKAQSVEKLSDGTVTWQAGVNGVTLEFNANGAVKRIYSKYSHPVTIADKRGIHTATIIAEEKAKGEIVRFLQQHVASGRVVNEFENTVSKSTQERTSGGERLSSVDQRTISQSLNELTSSFASGRLSGVVVLENGYDDKEREAWVVVGLSEKTMAASRATQDMLMGTQPSGSGNTPTAAPADRPGRRIRRGNQDF